MLYTEKITLMPPSNPVGISSSLSFARGHLLNWLPGFSTDVAKYAETPFYAAAAQIALAFTQLDASMVEELLKELHGTAGEISA